MSVDKATLSRKRSSRVAFAVGGSGGNHAVLPEMVSVVPESGPRSAAIRSKADATPRASRVARREHRMPPMLSQPEAEVCTLRVNASSLKVRAYYRLYKPSQKRYWRTGGDMRWRGVMQPLLWRNDMLLMDVGGHLGSDLKAFLAHAPPGVSIHSYEPVREFSKQLRQRLHKLRFPNRTFVHGFGLGAADRTTCIMQLAEDKLSPSAFERRGDSSACPTAPSRLRDAAAVVAGFAPRRVNLFQINCEGCEYEVLERLIAQPAELARIDALEVQFHLDWSLTQNETHRYCSIERGLRSSGFQMAYRFPFVWERWDRHPDAFFAGLQSWAGKRRPNFFVDCAGAECAQVSAPFTVGRPTEMADFHVTRGTTT